jgi:hypothetical protein
MDEFYAKQLYPLFMRCLRESIVLILIHEVSYDPKTEKNRPFFWKLYDRVELCKIHLEKSFQRSKNRLLIAIPGYDPKNSLYKINDSGLEIIA